VAETDIKANLESCLAVTRKSPSVRRNTIRALVLDIDGVLTDGRVIYDEQRHESKELSYRDIDAVFQARREGLQVALVTGEESPMVDVIARRLAVKTVIISAKDKALALQELCARLDITLDQVCYLGDSDRDASALAQVGLGLAPANASPQARLSAHRVLTSQGGYGAVAEALALIRRLNTDGQVDTEANDLGADRVVENTSALQQSIVTALQESIAVKQAVVETLSDRMAIAAEWIVETLHAGHKLLLFGNGGSAAEAQHIAAEFVGRFERERQAWPAIALTTNTSILTALGNDYGLEIIFARQVLALGQPGDLVLAFSTSGNSPNVVQGVVAARALGLRTVGLTGESGGRLAPLCDLALCVPSRHTARIQECHIAICHAICQVVEATLAAGA
jgi:D-sedoheptulose 7-phosphate isomerase